MRVEVVRSPRRRKTVQAREVNGVLRVSIPATMTKADEERWVQEMVRRMARRAATEAVDLGRRAEELA
ncbi:metal-dependent hydrolase, partial [Acidimicrobiaceae bacterium USS-CC1]|nr:metal-dependent hydrolase [Acidiferrimicrobium australe]